MNEETRLAAGAEHIASEARTPEIIGAEIRTLSVQCNTMRVQYAIEIGRRLVEAKELCKHGEWMDFLKRETAYSQPKASRLMQIFREYGAEQGSLFGAEPKYSTLNNLSISSALRLLELPEEERESFVEEHDVEHLSTKQVEALVKERTAELEAQKEKIEAAAADDREKREREEEARKKAEEQLKRIQQELREIEARPVEVAVERDEQAIEEAVAAARKESEQEIAALRAKAEEAERSGAEAPRLREQIKDLEGKLTMASPEVAEFKAAFDRAQAELVKMLEALRRVEDAELRSKLAGAARSVLEQFSGQVEG